MTIGLPATGPRRGWGVPVDGSPPHSPLLEVDDMLQVVPGGLQVLQHEPAVTALGGGFAAEERGGAREERAVEALLDRALGHQRAEALSILLPGDSFRPVGLEERLGGGKERFVHVFRATEFAQEEGEVVPLRESGELGGVV